MKTGEQRSERSDRDEGRHLVPTPTPDRSRTRAQETFRTLLAKVASLRDAIDAEEEELDATLSFYAADIVPKIARQTALQKELVRALGSSEDG
jgi:hypothetical protein